MVQDFSNIVINVCQANRNAKPQALMEIKRALRKMNRTQMIVTSCFTEPSDRNVGFCLILQRRAKHTYAPLSKTSTRAHGYCLCMLYEPYIQRARASGFRGCVILEKWTCCCVYHTTRHMYTLKNSE